LNKETCFHRSFTNVEQPLVDGDVSIYFSLKQQPFVIDDLILYAVVLDGILEGVYFNTKGTMNRDIVLWTLTKIYGKPTGLKVTPAQTMGGLKFDKIIALWSFRDLEVIYDSCTGSIDKGEVSIMTDKATKYHEKAEAHFQKFMKKFSEIW
jgi:hypothetical protein